MGHVWVRACSFHSIPPASQPPKPPTKDREIARECYVTGRPPTVARHVSGHSGDVRASIVFVSYRFAISIIASVATTLDRCWVHHTLPSPAAPARGLAEASPTRSIWKGKMERPDIERKATPTRRCTSFDPDGNGDQCVGVRWTGMRTCMPRFSIGSCTSRASQLRLHHTLDATT